MAESTTAAVIQSTSTIPPRPLRPLRFSFRSSRLALELFAGGGLGGSQPGGQDTERRAGNVVHAHLVAELHRRRVSAVLAANAHLQIAAGLAPALCAHLHQLAYAF